MSTKKDVHYAIHDHFAAQGDHLGAQHADPSKRVVPGHGTVDARQPVCRHSNKQSVGSDTLAEISAKGATTANVKVGG